MTEINRPTPSRRTVLRAGFGLLGAAGVAVVGAQAARAQDAQKLAQTAVQYQSHPNSDHPGQLCSVCANFVAPNQCKLVQGPISPIGWCVAFAPKG